MCIKHDSSTHYQININTHPTESLASTKKTQLYFDEEEEQRMINSVRCCRIRP